MESKKSGKLIIFCILYGFVFCGITAVVILRFLDIIQSFDMEYIYLLLILAVLAVIPFFDKVSFMGITAEKTHSNIEEAGSNKVEEIAREEQQELDNIKDKVEPNFTVKDIKEALIKQYCNDNAYGINIDDLKDNRQISNINDKISNENPVFTKYAHKNEKEFLFDIKFTEINATYRNKLYVMLSKILMYKNTNNKNIRLIVLILRYEEQNKIGVSSEASERLKEYFSPAIDSGLLEVRTIYCPLSKIAGCA